MQRRFPTPINMARRHGQMHAAGNGRRHVPINMQPGNRGVPTVPQPGPHPLPGQTPPIIPPQQGQVHLGDGVDLARLRRRANGNYDPRRAVQIGNSIYDLRTGSVLSGGGGPLNDHQLQASRRKAGWSLEGAMNYEYRHTPQWELTPGNPAGTAGSILTDPELYQRYLDAARANYQQNANQQITNPNGQALLDAGTIRTDVPGAAPSYQNQPQGGGTGASTKPPLSPAQQAEVDRVKSHAQAAHGTPQAAINAGKDPTKHVAYWQSQGWDYNPANDQWTQANDPHPHPQQTPGGPPPGGPASGPGGYPAGTPTGGGGGGSQTPDGTNMMPLDPDYIAAQRAAQYQLNNTLSGTNPALEQIAAQQALAEARLNTNEGVDKQEMMESLAGRGVMNSSLYGDATGKLATDYLRQFQDLGSNVAQAYSSVYGQQQDAYNTYTQNLIEALLAAGNRAETSAYTPVNGRTRRKRKGKGRRRG